MVVQIRLMADDAAELTHAMSDLETVLGTGLQLAAPAQRDAQGDWLADGTWTLASTLPTPAAALRDELAVRRRGRRPQR